MVGRPAWSAAILLTVLAVIPRPASAQMAHRLKGVVVDDDGKRVAGARVRAAALAGFLGGQFVGQRDFSVTANSKGEWTVLGLTAGVWLFQADAAGSLPAAIVLTIDFSSRRPISATGGQLRWELPITLRRADGQGALTATADAVLAGDPAAAQQISALSVSDDVAQLVAAGELALIARQGGLADALFARVLAKEPKHPRALVGVGSAALMNSDWDRASKHYWQARDLAPADLRPALGNTITELQKIAATGGVLDDRR